MVMYTGMPRLAPEQEEEVAAAIRTRLEILRPAAAYGTATCDSDILCLEAVGRLGGETHVVLPFPAEDLRRLRVDLSRGEWSQRFERVLAAANSVTVTSDHRARGSAATFEYANLVLTGMARLRARLLRTDLRGIAIGGGRTASDGGVASSLLRDLAVTECRSRAGADFPSKQGCSETRRRCSGARRRCGGARRWRGGHGTGAASDGFAHEIRAMLFADAVGYSALSEDQTPDFITQFLGAVADLNARSAQRPEHVETTGDGLYMVFGSVRDAGDYAMQLNRLVSGTDWAARGLPGGLNMRIALHCGPVYLGIIRSPALRCTPVRTPVGPRGSNRLHRRARSTRAALSPRSLRQRVWKVWRCGTLGVCRWRRVTVSSVSTTCVRLPASAGYCVAIAP